MAKNIDLRNTDCMILLSEMESKTVDLVLDCFSGSGSTAIACHQTKRNFIGSELDEDFYNISMKRIDEVTSQTLLF